MESITSVAQLMEFVDELCTNSPDLHLFRGQACDKPLLPKIARGHLKPNFEKQEQRLMDEFKIRSRPYLDLPNLDNWDWLAIAQHNRMVTRLLDWTDNPLAALWFAVETPPDKQQHGVLWWFRVLDKDRVVSQENEDPFKCTRTKVFRPKHITRSIVAQGGWFTVHKYLPNGTRFIPIDNNSLYKTRIGKLLIEPNKFPELRRQLDRCGINRSTMFPDLTGLCEHLNWAHQYDLKVLPPEYLKIVQVR